MKNETDNTKANKSEKFKFGAVYDCNCKKPDLPDDALVEVVGLEMFGKRQVRFVGWSTTPRFRLVDERYK